MKRVYLHFIEDCITYPCTKQQITVSTAFIWTTHAVLLFVANKGIIIFGNIHIEESWVHHISLIYKYKYLLHIPGKTLHKPQILES